MWIVSQDGTIIANTDTMQGITVNDNIINIHHVGANGLLGCYSSNEKAIKVRNNLLDTAKGIIFLTNIEPHDDKSSLEFDDWAQKRFKEAIHIVDDNKKSKIEPYMGRTIFYMPQDEEVSV